LADRSPSWARWPTNRTLWHVANSAGPHAATFAAMRAYGPLLTARFDPHP
jgi:hypothetical protein